MFVEQVCWTVPREKTANISSLLSLLHHYMDANGGLVKALVGSDVESQDRIISLTFWKGWEDLSRFLASPKASLLSDAYSNEGKAPQPHHFEVVWEWPEEEVDTMCGESCIAIHEFFPAADRIQGLLDALRLAVPKLRHQDGFHGAGLWLDKNSEGHIALVTQWSANCLPDLELPARLLPGNFPVGIANQHLFKVQLTDPHHVGIT